MSGDLTAIKDAQQPPTGDKHAGANFDLASFFPSDNSTTLGTINQAMAGGNSAFDAKVLPEVKGPPQNQLTKNDTNCNFPAALAALDNKPSSKNQEEAMKIFDEV